MQNFIYSIGLVLDILNFQNILAILPPLLVVILIIGGLIEMVQTEKEFQNLQRIKLKERCTCEACELSDKEFQEVIWELKSPKKINVIQQTRMSFVEVRS